MKLPVLDQELNSITVRISGVVNESMVDGPGIRTTVFFQGCCHECPGCHNPETWDINGGVELSLAQLIPRLNLNPLVSGVTFSGGEPFLQAGPAAVLGKIIKHMGLNLWVYTGYLWEELLATPDRSFKELLEIADVLIDGPYIERQQDLSLAFKGSRNQRIIDVRASFNTGKATELTTAVDGDI